MSDDNKYTLYQNINNSLPSIGRMNLNDMREKLESMKKEDAQIQLCPEAAFMQNDKEQLYKVITRSVIDMVEVKRRRGRPLGSKNRR